MINIEPFLLFMNWKEEHFLKDLEIWFNIWH